MSSYVLSGRAMRDLAEILSYIAEDSEHHADRVEAAVYGACAFLEKTPYAGRLRPEVTGTGVRFWHLPQFRNYVLIYDANQHPLLIVRILHAARNMRKELRSSGS